MIEEKRAKILLAACAVAAFCLSTHAFAQAQVFVDNFNNGTVANSDTATGFWTTVVSGSGTVTEPGGGPINLTAMPANPQNTYPFSEIGSSALQSSFNFFQQPIILHVSGLGYSAGSTANSLTEFNFGSQVIDPILRTTVKPAAPDHINTEYDEYSDFSLEIDPPGGPNGQLIMGEKANYTNAETPWDSYQLIGPIGHVTTGPVPSHQVNVGGQVRSFTLVLSSQFYYLSVVSDTSTTNSTPITTNYSGGLNLMNTGQYPWTTGTYAPGDPSLNIETQIGGSNGADTASLNISQVQVSQMSLTYNPNGDGNWFTPSNWSGLSSAIDTATATSLGINIPDKTSASAVLPQVGGPTTVALNNGNGNTITLGSLNINSSQPYTINGGIVQFATSGSTDQINVTAGNHTINAGLTIYDAHTNINLAAGSSLLVNGPVSTPYNAMSIDTTGGTGALTITGDISSNGAITLSSGTGGITVNGGTNNDFLFHGPLTLNVVAGGTLTINSYIDDPFNGGNPPGLYPVSKTGGGLAVVSTLYQIPNVTVTGGILRIAPSPTANNFNYGGSLIYGLALSGGKLDLTNNDLVFNYTNYVGNSSAQVLIRGYLQSGSLYSSTASLALGTTVGYADATEINQTSAFYGLTTGNSALCLMYTYYGDLNLSGSVDGTDLGLMTSGNGSDWYHGDLNYDGAKNADDWALYQLGVAESNARGSINNLPAPEPASLAMLGMLGLGLMKRKRAL